MMWWVVERRLYDAFRISLKKKCASDLHHYIIISEQQLLQHTKNCISIAHEFNVTLYYIIEQQWKRKIFYNIEKKYTRYVVVLTFPCIHTSIFSKSKD